MPPVIESSSLNPLEAIDTDGRSTSYAAPRCSAVITLTSMAMTTDTDDGLAAELARPGLWCGPKDDPRYSARRVLHTGTELLAERRTQRLERPFSQRQARWSRDDLVEVP